MSLINRLRNNQLDLAQPATRRTLRTLAAFGVIVLTANLSLTLSSSHNAIVVPSGYQLATEIQLDHRLEDQPIYRFTLNQASTVNFFIELNQVNGAPTQIQLFGPEGHLFTFLQDNDPQAQFTHASCHPAGMQLNPGTYEIRATLQPSPGSVRVYMLIE